MEWVFLQVRHDALQQLRLGFLFQSNLVSSSDEYSNLANEKNIFTKPSCIKMHGSEGTTTEEKAHIHFDYWNKIELEIAHNAVHVDFLRYFEKDLLETVVLSSVISQRFFCCSWKLTLLLTHLVIRLKPWRDKESCRFTAVRELVAEELGEQFGLKKSKIRSRKCYAQYN